MTKHGRTTGEEILHEIQLDRGYKTSDRLRDILVDLADGIKLAVFVSFGAVILIVGLVDNFISWLDGR